jgi:alpha-tubulin suppressor-like RCC1 family protein
VALVIRPGAWLSIGVLATASGCELVAGLDADRHRALPETADPPAEVCTAGALRCNLGAREVCSDTGQWSLGESCAQSCDGGVCVERHVAAGHHHSCAALADGVRCWGRSDLLQLGVEGGEPCPDVSLCRASPVLLPDSDGVRDLATLAHHSCAIRADEVICWGDNRFAQLGRPASETPGSASVRITAQLPVADDRPVAVRVGGGNYSVFWTGHSCALTAAGRLYCWGANCAGQLGLGVDPVTCPAAAANCEAGDVETNVPQPTPVPLPAGAIQIALGSAHSCALSATGQVYCWGWNTYGQSDPHGTEQCFALPRLVPGIERAVHIVAGGRNTCAVIDDGRVVCWGASENLQLGSETLEYGPLEVPIPPAIAAVAGHGTHLGALTSEGDLWCWGENTNGECGVIESTIETPEGIKVEPAKVPPTLVDLPAVHRASLGGNHSCAWTRAGALYCWGQSRYGAIGTGTMGDPTTPVEVDPSQGAR